MKNTDTTEARSSFRCLDCGRALRNSSEPPISGTIPNAGHGLCTTCKRRRIKRGIPLPPPSRRQGRPKGSTLARQIEMIQAPPPPGEKEIRSVQLLVADQALKKHADDHAAARDYIEDLLIVLGINGEED